MSTNTPECYADDFLEQILAIPSYSAPGNGGNLDEPPSSSSMLLQLNSGAGSVPPVDSGGFEWPMMFPLGLSLNNGFPSPGCEERANLVKSEGETLQLASLCSAFGHVQPYSSVQVQQPTISHIHQAFHGQPTPGVVVAAPQPPIGRVRVRARRGQATDPHSIAERLRRERISERVKALQELVPSCNKTDRAAMLDGILDYVKFLRLQVKVLSMSRLGGTGAVAQLVSDCPLPSVEQEVSQGESNQLPPWDKWSDDNIEEKVAKLMEEDVGSAMQLLQSKSLCIMPISLAAAIYSTQKPETPKLVSPEPNAPS